MFSLLRNVYNNSSVLVTGHTGFKGGWLSLWLSMLGAKVVGYSLEAPSEPSFFEITGIKSNISHIYGDIRELAHLKRVFQEYKPAFIFHLAAQSLVLFSYEEPHLTYETNVMGTVNVLEAIRDTESVRAAIIVTSDKCYENQEMIWGHREIDPMGGPDPYSSSKGCAELVTSAYMKSFFTPDTYNSKHMLSLGSARAGNVIGGGDWAEHRLIPDCVRALSQGKPIRVRNPRSVRPWQHVFEPLSGYLLLAARLKSDKAQFSGSWNFGPIGNEVWSVEELVQEIISLWGEGSYGIEKEFDQHESHWLRLDSSKALSKLRWHPKYSTNEALKKTISWYKLYYQGADKEDMLNYSKTQIDDYMV
jgi:CDP-glucose 4,6-dehydratase